MTEENNITTEKEELKKSMPGHRRAKKQAVQEEIAPGKDKIDPEVKDELKEAGDETKAESLEVTAEADEETENVTAEADEEAENATAEAEAENDTDGKEEEPANDEGAAADKEAGKKPSFAKRHAKELLILVPMALIVVVVAIIALTPQTKKNKTNYMDQIRSQEVEESGFEAINDFFGEYYKAMATGNTTALDAMYNDPSKANVTTEVSQIVDGYDNLKVYVTKGIDENSIVAFVYSDMHFANIDKTAPAVDSFYLNYYPEDGSLKINADMYTDEEILKYMNLVSYREPVRSLLDDTDKALDEALSSDKNLKNLYLLMQSMTTSVPYADSTQTQEIPADDN